MENKIQKQIEGILFWKAEPVDTSEVAKILNVEPTEILEAAQILKEKMQNSGINLLINGNEIALITSPENGPLIENLIKDEINKDLSKAALETLSIILYKGPIKRSEIDYIRGVNSQFIIRNLLIRGLIIKEQNSQDERGFFYKASSELLNFMGISNINEMPEYQKIQEEINKFIVQNNNLQDEKTN
jgi:segregation and condensation protein B